MIWQNCKLNQYLCKVTELTRPDRADQNIYTLDYLLSQSAAAKNKEPENNVKLPLCVTGLEDAGTQSSLSDGFISLNGDIDGENDEEWNGLGND